MDITVVFVHGYSVTNYSTYGELPLRLKAEALLNGLNITVTELYLGRYISFEDEVCMDDISRALDAALTDKLKPNERFVCITHSTGGPVLRDWWNKFLEKKVVNNTPNLVPSLSHLIMLAPANFGSPLAQLGKERLSRVKAWVEGVEPGQKVLNWLELGSSEAWTLNKKWIDSDGSQIGSNGVFPFVITGQSIDRKLYDHINSYTGELGSDGVVRTAATNLKSTYIKLVQKTKIEAGNLIITGELEKTVYTESPAVPFRVMKGKSHGGDKMGIMKSVKNTHDDTASQETVNAILECIQVKDMAGYDALKAKFENETAQVQKEELVEPKANILSRNFVHDRYSQVIFRITDSQGNSITDYDLIFMGEKDIENDDDDGENNLPEGFLADRQRNSKNIETITYFFNYDILNGTPEISGIRPALPGIKAIGFKVKPRPDKGFVRFMECKILANTELLEKALKPNSTTMVDIVIHRVVSKDVVGLDELKGNNMPDDNAGNFKKNVKPGDQFLK